MHAEVASFTPAYVRHTGRLGILLRQTWHQNRRLRRLRRLVSLALFTFDITTSLAPHSPLLTRFAAEQLTLVDSGGSHASIPHPAEVLGPRCSIGIRPRASAVCMARASKRGERRAVVNYSMSVIYLVA